MSFISGPEKRGKTKLRGRKTEARLLFVLSLLILATASVHAQQHVKGSLWDVPEIRQVPSYRVVARDTVISLIYHGLPYRGRPASVFAYYASPATIGTDTVAGRRFPGIVLVHGGGGRAFAQWVVMWARKGYAAIAMDLRGNGGDGAHIEGGFVEPGHETPYFKITPSLDEQWMFQAVADVLLAHNLIRSFPEIDPSRTAVTGISWGGVITSVVTGLDERFKAAVPVYGCGYLWQSGRMKTQLDELSQADRKAWITQYDPAGYLKNAVMPMLFLNDAQDPYFALPSYMKSYRDVPNATLCVKTDLRHGHPAGWSNEEIYYFINACINGTKSLAWVGKPQREGSRLTAVVRAPVRITEAWLYYTLDTSSSGEGRTWMRVKAVVRRNTLLTSPFPPPGTTMCYFLVRDSRGAVSSGEVYFRPPVR
jgi:dienelactone hydrolase